MANGFARDAGQVAGTEGPHLAIPGLMTIDSYVASGYAPSAGDAGLRAVRRVRPEGPTDRGYLLRWDGSSGKVRAFKHNKGGSVTESWPDVKGGVFADLTADQAAAALNDAAVLALTDATVTTAGGLAHADGLMAGLTNPNAIDAEVVGRNVVVAQNQNGAGGSWTAGYLRVTGTAPDGSAQVEDIALQTTAIADTKFRLVVGTKAFATVTNLKLLNAAKTAAQAGPASSRLSVGVGTIFGLRQPIGAESDVKSVRKDGAAVAAATYVATASPSQIDLGANVADDVDLMVQYEASTLGGYDLEAASTENVGVARVVVIGD